MYVSCKKWLTLLVFCRASYHPIGRVSLQHASVRYNWAAVPEKFGLHLFRAAAPSTTATGSQSGRAAMCVLSDRAQLSVRSLKLPVRLGACGMRPHNGRLMQGCIRSSPSSPPAALASLRTCVQGTAAVTAGLFGSALVVRPRLVSVRAPGEPLRRLGQVSGVSG
ncbi:hypothetical protein NDU88_010867 [Pleurodeles waltl]|uniref:Secreted protein n=1 Tax=Pleurodeles waltl TaxID=8319 RepID=A0AAV7QVL6_PLEWA|nr:hypothetical protein NDU88_010867 [Pleurodeles waltl]